MHGRNDSVKFAFKKNLNHVMIHEYVRYKFKEKRMLCCKQQDIYFEHTFTYTDRRLTDIESCRKDSTCITSFIVWTSLAASHF